ncbi:MAG TPA: hypothetical protein VLI04_17425 [Nocardioidaceae bacterium]|nr:hypothetical protein [Nocardioidaceae bacterium]
MEITSIFDLSIPQPNAPPERDVAAALENREARATRKLISLLETRHELRGVYPPADAIAETLRWSA